MAFLENTVFDHRYLLKKSLGRGASAQVWLAEDTQVSNLRVALKILSERSGMDTYGIQNFQQEFTNVYNLHHQNILKPTGYSICDGVPYLVLPYCENGSAENMSGRCDENDIIKILHDVSAGLEYLHSQGIVHQDIKPDNILVDDECNFMVTDFGISTRTDSMGHGASGRSGGTREYMGPERCVSGALAEREGDIWALGASIYQLLTGYPPFGDHGGLVQASGEPIPEMPANLQPEVADMIRACLDADPQSRPTAEQIRKKTERYLETGSWKEPNGKKYLYISLAATAAVLLAVVIWVWDYNRTKVYYYKDYVEYWGVPKGIGRLTGSEMHHRENSYRMEVNRGKVRRLSLVNSHDNLTWHIDTENMLTRHTDVRYYYTDDGKIDYKTVFDQAGKLLYKMDYDADMKTVTFRQNDEYGTEMNLRANTTDLQNQGMNFFEQKSHISRYLLTHDKKGLLTQVRYVGLQNVPAGDADNIYGITYKYDKKGHKIEEQFLGADGEPTSNNLGLSIKCYDYDSDDNWCEVSYLNIERGPSHDGNNCALVKIKSDEWGNRIAENYYTLDGEPSIRTDAGVAGFSYRHDDRGHRITLTHLGFDGSPIISINGYAEERLEYDENGYCCRSSYYDTAGNPANLVKDGNSFSRVDFKNNEHGQKLEMAFYDEEGNPIVNTNGVFLNVYTYDSLGNCIMEEYFDAQKKPVLYDGLISKIRIEFDEFNHITAFYYYDTENKPTTYGNEVASQHFDYNRQGSLVKIYFLDINNKPALGDGLFASVTYDYDELGNQKTIQFFDKEGRLTNNDGGVAKREFTYDSKTNFCIEMKEFDSKGKLVSTLTKAYDKRGNVIREQITGANGQLLPGKAVLHTEYDTNNRPLVQRCTNLKDQPINKPGSKYAKVVNVYDNRGNNVEQTFWDTSGKPAVDEQKTFKRERKFNDMGLIVYERNLDANGKPLVGTDVNPEGKVEYDKFGNIVKIECFDGYGKPRISSDGFYCQKAVYNSKNRCTERAYYGLNNQLVKSKSSEFARKTSEYNDHGDEIKACYYNEKNKRYRIDIYKYNDKNRLSEMLILNDSEKQDDSFWGFSKRTTSYNSSGLIPKQMAYYDAKGNRLAYQNYDEGTKKWGAIVNSNPMHGLNVVGSHWKQTIMEASAQCPIDGGNGAIIRSISLDGDVVTCVVRIMPVDLDEMSDEVLQNIRQMMGQAVAALKQTLGIPSSARLIVILQDKNGKRIQ